MNNELVREVSDALARCIAMNIERDVVEPADAYGFAGWTENDATVVLYDQFDLWEVTLATQALIQSEADLRLLRKVAENDLSNLGDTSTLADPSVVDELIANRVE